MNNGKRQKEIPIEVEESSGNVFADLGLPNAAELPAKSNVIGDIHAAMEQDHLTDDVAAKWLGIEPDDLDAILRGDLDRYSIEELTSMHRNLNEIRDAMKIFHQDRQKAKAKVAEINPVIKSLRKTGMLRSGERVVGKILEVWVDQYGSDATYNHAAIEVPKGVGVYRYILEVGKELNEETMGYTIDRFVPFNKCGPSLQAKLLPFIDPLVDELKQKVVRVNRPRPKSPA